MNRDEVARSFRAALTRTDIEQYLVMALGPDDEPLGVAVIAEGSDSECGIGFGQIIEAAEKFGVENNRIVTAHSHVVPGKVSEADVVHCAVLAELGLGQSHFVICHKRGYVALDFYEDD